MSKSKLTWEWAGENLTDIIIRKDKGKLTLDDIWYFLHRPEQLNVFDGKIAVIMFTVSSDRDESLSIFEDKDAGDAQLIHFVEDDSQCPICGRNKVFQEYCPECGTKLQQPIQRRSIP